MRSPEGMGGYREMKQLEGMGGYRENETAGSFWEGIEK